MPRRTIEVRQSMKFIIAPDSYKGSLTSREAGAIIARAIQQEIPESKVSVIPMADGGEGTVEAVLAAIGGEKVGVKAAGPLGNEVDTYYGIIEWDGRRTAVIEAANICGLSMVPASLRKPLNTTSRGLGEVIVDALDRGIRSFIIGLGGSATNDGGIGMLSALGVHFTAHDGSRIAGYGRDLAFAVQADASGLDPRIGGSRITIACDVTNPLLGRTGATYVYGPQKGASVKELDQLEQAMAAYADLTEACFARSCREIPGSGAAGGLGFAFMLLGGEIVSGAELILSMTDLKQRIQEADWVITGEGRSDAQTLYGKLPLHAAKLAKEAGKPAILLSGSLGPGSEGLNDYFTACFSIVPGPADLKECMREAANNLYACARQIARLLSKITG